jgi:hypothetical protein
VGEKGFLAPLVVEELKERSKMKKACWKKKNREMKNIHLGLRG